MVKQGSGETHPRAGLPRPAALPGGPKEPPARGEAVISVSDLRMRYGDRDAVAGLSFEVRRDDDAANPVITAVTLPLYFISGVFLPAPLLPHWLVQVAGIFPVRHFQLALLAAYNPHSATTGLAGRDLEIMAGWGAAGLLIAARRFRWTPQSS